MNFGEAIKSVFSKYATFSGRARRSEFWYFFLLNALVGIVLSLIPFLSFLSFIWSLGVFIPFLAVTVRRFHDIGKSGWYYLVPVIPALAYVGYIFYFVFMTIRDMGDTFTEKDALYQHILSNTPALVTMGILGLLAFVTWIIWIVWMAKDSEPGENQWGPNPKEQTETEPQNLD